MARDPDIASDISYQASRCLGSDSNLLGLRRQLALQPIDKLAWAPPWAHPSALCR